MKVAPLYKWNGCPSCTFIGTGDIGSGDGLVLYDVYGCGINNVRPFYYHIVGESGQGPSVMSTKLESSEWCDLIERVNGIEDDPSVSPNARARSM